MPWPRLATILTRHGVFRGQDTTEDQAQREHQVRNVTTVLGRLVEGDNEVGESRRKEQERPNEKEHEESSYMNVISCVLVESNRVVPGEEDEDGHKTVPGDFDHDVGQHEDFPTVRL